MNPTGYSYAPGAALRSLWTQRELIWQMSKREVLGRYKGSIFGLFWWFFTPLLMLAIYTFVFAVVFQVRWGEARMYSESRFEFALILFSGTIIHALFSENITRAPGLIVGNVNYVKRVVFPLETLPWVAMLVSLFQALVSFAVLLVSYVLFHANVHWTVVFVPIVVAPLILFAIGISWFLASLGVFLRDIGQVMGLVTTILLFLSPVFYPVSSIPEPYRLLFYLNPLTFIIDQTRAVLLWGEFPHWIGLAVYFGVALIIAWLGYAWFQKTRKGFADVL